MQKVSALFHGKVQGVFFRANCRDKARSLGVSGWVRNRSDGTVEMEAEGNENDLQELLDWCKTSQPHARVDRVELNWSTGKPEYREFRIIR